MKVRASARSSNLPRWLVAQEFILEISGRVTGVGLFTDDVIHILLPVEAPDPSPEQPVGVRNLSLLLSCAGFEGPQEFLFTLESPGEIKIEMGITTPDRPASALHHLVLNLGTFPVDSLGIYVVRARCEALQFDSFHRFEIRRRPPDTQLLTARPRQSTAASQRLHVDKIAASKKRRPTKSKPATPTGVARKKVPAQRSKK
jgi:hypothetical protein